MKFLLTYELFKLNEHNRKDKRIGKKNSQKQLGVICGRKRQQQLNFNINIWTSNVMSLSINNFKIYIFAIREMRGDLEIPKTTCNFSYLIRSTPETI
jgi:hypothetical protein